MSESPWINVEEVPPEEFPVLIKSNTGHYSIATAYQPETDDFNEFWIDQDDGDWLVEHWPKWMAIPK